jgi:hypothetical protein
MSEHHTITRRKLLRQTTALAGIYAGASFAVAGRTLSEFNYGEVQLARSLRCHPGSYVFVDLPLQVVAQFFVKFLLDLVATEK